MQTKIPRPTRPTCRNTNCQWQEPKTKPKVAHLALPRTNLDRHNVTKNIASLIATVVTINGHATQNEAPTEVVIVTTVVKQAVHLDVAEAGIATATVTITKAEIRAAVIAAEGKTLEEETPTQWITPQGHALGSVLVIVHDPPRSAAVTRGLALVLILRI